MTPVRFIKIKALFLGAVLLGAGVAQAEPGQRIYIPTGDSAEVLIIDAGTNGVIGEIAGLPAAHGLAVTPDGSRLIAGSFDEREPSTAMPEKPAGVSAADHAAHHAPKPSAAVQPMVSTLSVVDTATRSVVRRIDVPGAVHHVAVSPDGRVAAVTHPYADAVSVIDLETLAVIKTVPTGAMPNYAAFSRDGEKLYVSNSGEDTIAVLDRSTWSVAGRIAAGQSPEHLALSPDGGRLFVVTGVGPNPRSVELALNGQVHGPIAIFPKAVNLFAQPASGRPDRLTGTITLQARPERPTFEIEGVEGDDERLTLEMVPDPENRRHRVAVRWNTKEAKGDFSGMIRIKTSNPDMPEILVPYRVRIL